MASQTQFAGSRILASFLNSIAPLNAVRSSTQSVSSSTTLVNDDTLFLALAANATYNVELLLLYSGGTQLSSDMKWGFTLPSGASGAGETSHLAISGGSAVYANQATNLTASGSANVCATGGAGTAFAAKTTATIFTTGAGTLQLQWAQNTSSATATIMGIGSSLVAWRLA
jgi:hypothetical protein